MTIISDLEQFQQKLVGDGLTELAVELQNIIESAKREMQEPAAYQIRILGERWAGCAKHIYNPNNPNTRALFTHPPLSAETVKDAARYIKLKSAIQESGEYGEHALARHLGWHPDTFKIGFDQAIDEAMKAAK